MRPEFPGFMSEHAPPHSLLYSMYHYRALHCPVSFKSKYQIAKINLLKLNIVRKINQTVEKGRSASAVTAACYCYAATVDTANLKSHVKWSCQNIFIAH